MERRDRSLAWHGFTLLALSLAVAPATAGSLYGPLGNFDVVNDTGSDTCGFEIEIEGVHSADVYRTFASPAIRYPAPSMTDTPSGILIRYQGQWDPATQSFLQSTPPAPPGYVPRNDSCWTGGLGTGYASSGCEHFGVSHRSQALSTRYRWLACNPDGTTSPLPDIGLPSPTWVVTPAPFPANPPVVRAEFDIPNPEGAAYGEPYWTKIYKTEVGQEAVLEDLLMENPAVANAATEIEWELLQSKPGADLAFNEAPVAAGDAGVLRRYEFYHYNEAWGRTHTFIDPETGLPVPYVDPANGEVVACVVDGCNDPTPDELGDYIGRQIAGFNLEQSACSNGADDDGDGLADFDGGESVHGPCVAGVCPAGVTDPDGDGVPNADPQCVGLPWRNAEAGRGCGLGGELALLLPLLGWLRRSRRT